MKSDFSHFSEQMGLTGEPSKSWPSPFNYEQQGILYVPQGLPDPNSMGYTDAVLDLALPVIDAQGCILGVVSLEDVHLASQSPNIQQLIVAADLMRTNVTPLGPNERLDRALELFVESGLPSLPVGIENG